MNTTYPPCEAAKQVLKELTRGKAKVYMYGVKKKNGKMKWMLLYGLWRFEAPSEREVVEKFYMLHCNYGFH